MRNKPSYVLARKGALFAAVAALAALGAVVLSAQNGRSYALGPVWWQPGRGIVFPAAEDYDTPGGVVAIVNTAGVLRPQGHAFFEALGSNGRACITCHQPENAMSSSTATVRQRWSDTEGTDPIFAGIDGSNCPDLPQMARASHSLLLDRGLFRIALPWPPQRADGSVVSPDFQIEIVRDPTGCNNSAVYGFRASHPQVSVYRRPRMVANLNDASSLMTDGREPSLRTQAITAALVHEQASAQPSEAQLRQITDFEAHLFAAQGADARGGRLTDGPALLGPANVASGRASTLRGAPGLAPVSFAAWQSPQASPPIDVQAAFRSSVARGANLFFARSFRMQQGVTQPGSATCATCHQESAVRWMDIGTTNQPTAKDAPELPLFRITCDASARPHPSLGRVIYTQDPGRALITGKCADTGSIVMQQLRGLAARAPYFSNGGANSLRAVVEFYDRRFGIGYSEQEKQDLVNFLSAL